MEEMSELEEKLKNCDLQIQKYVAELKSENERLNNKIVKNAVSIQSLKNENNALKKEIKENKPKFGINFNFREKKGND